MGSYLVQSNSNLPSSQNSGQIQYTVLFAADRFYYIYKSGPKIAANSNIPAFLLLTEQGRYIGVRLYLTKTKGRPAQEL